MTKVLAAIHHATAEGHAPAPEAELQNATRMQEDELSTTLKDLEFRGMAIRHATGWALPVKAPKVYR